MLQDAKSLASPVRDAAAMVNFRAVMENTDDYIYFKDRNHVFTGASQTLVALCQPAEHWTDLLGQTDYDVFPEAYADIYYRLEKHVFAGIPVAHEIQESLTRDGRRGWVDNRKYPIRDDAGEIIGLYGIARDITEAKRTEQALRDSVARFRAISESAQDAIILMDADGQVSFWNAAAEAIFGYAREEALGRDLHALIAPQGHLESQRRGFEQFRQSGEGAMVGKTLSFTARRKDGRELPVELSMNRVEINGQWCAVGIVRDISQRRADEDRLRKLAQAVEQSPESIAITNLAGEIEYVNDAFVRATGYSREELNGSNPRILQSGKTPRQTYAAMWAALQQGQPWMGELHNRRKDGSEYTELASIAPLRQPDGRVSHYVAVKEDITERKRIAEELAQHRNRLEELVASRTADLSVAREAAEAASRAKSSFLASMSHELRTPLNGIMGMTDLARRRATDPRQKEQLDRVALASSHLLEVINDILDIARIEANRLELKVVDFTLGGLMDEMTGLLSQQATQKGLKLCIDIDRRLAGLPVQGDPMRLRQILLNLSGNAIKFTEHGSTVLHARVAQEHENQVMVRFEVRDTGIGISAQDQTRLFAPFQQIDASLTRSYGGTGLGLAICKRLAEAMGGSIGITSQPGVGSTFWFTVLLGKAAPALAAGAAQANAPQAPDAEDTLRADHTGARVLLVEDEPINQEVARYLLAEAGLDVDVADDGLQALEMAKRTRYALILMDLQMPRMNGLDATRAIRALPGCEALPIVAMTANAFEEDRQSCMEAGMNDFIAKPVRPGLLHEMTLRWLRQREVEDFDRPVSAPPPLRTPLP